MTNVSMDMLMFSVDIWSNNFQVEMWSSDLDMLDQSSIKIYSLCPLGNQITKAISNRRVKRFAEWSRQMNPFWCITKCEYISWLLTSIVIALHSHGREEIVLKILTWNIVVQDDICLGVWHDDQRSVTHVLVAQKICTPSCHQTEFTTHIWCW